MTSDSPVDLAFHSFDPEEESEKLPIIFMHGLTSSKEHWKDIPQTVANATKRKAFVLDARNHGDSEWRDRFDFECMMGDLLHFMDSRKIERAILVGHSMGGIVGIKTALGKPERVEKLVVEDMYIRRVPSDNSAALLACIRLAKAGLQQLPDGADEETAQKLVVDFIYKSLPPEALPKVSKKSWADLDLKRTANGQYSFKFNVDAVENLLKNVHRTEYKGVNKGLASFIYGELSPYHVGEEEEHIKKFFPNAEFVEIPNATHKVHSDCPKEFTEVLIKFILEE